MSKFSPLARRILLIVGSVLCLLCFDLVGCDKIKSPNFSRRSNPRPARPKGGHLPRLAIIIDDVASDPATVDEIFALSYPLTLSILPNHLRSTQIAEEAHGRGYQLMLHLPMESQANEAPEVRELRSGMNTTEVAETLDEMLRSVPYARGVNNHQGSRATSDAYLMAELMPLLRARDLFFVDSRTTTATVAYEIAQRDGVRSAFRNVPFLDDIQQESAIRRQLELAIRGAQEKGEAIVIGHPHPETLRVLREVLPHVQSQGVQLVYVTSLVR